MITPLKKSDGLNTKLVLFVVKLMKLRALLSLANLPGVIGGLLLKVKTEKETLTAGVGSSSDEAVREKLELSVVLPVLSR